MHTGSKWAHSDLALGAASPYALLTQPNRCLCLPGQAKVLLHNLFRTGRTVCCCRAVGWMDGDGRLASWLAIRCASASSTFVFWPVYNLWPGLDLVGGMWCIFCLSSFITRHGCLRPSFVPSVNRISLEF